MHVLKCHKLSYFSLLDEEMFFAALKKISSVKSIEGEGWDLFVTVRSRPSQKSLRELLGLFFRYGIDMSQFAQFLTKQNQSWFCAPGAYWFEPVFPKNKKEKRSLTKR